MKKRNFSSFGLSTILLGFTMACIVTFSVLSFVTANSDYKLSKRVALNNTAYYDCSNEITQELSLIDKKLVEIYQSTPTIDKYYSLASTQLKNFSGELSEENGHIIYNIRNNISDSQYLEVQLQINYPDEPDDTFYTITNWQLHTDTTVDENNTLNLIGGK